METRHLKIVFVIDESGSMHGSNSDVIGGFNSYIDQQKQENIGKITVSLWKFNENAKVVISNKSAIDVAPLGPRHYLPGGSTALYDAVGKAISRTDRELFELPESERPDKIIMVIITDGMENASREYTSSALKAAIRVHEVEMKWSFVFLGSDLDNFSDADAMGINNRTYSSKEKMRDSFDSLSNSSCIYKRKSFKDENQFMEDLMSDLKEKGKKETEE